jgi:hypothetical protein
MLEELPQFYVPTIPWKYLLFYETRKKQGNKKRVVYVCSPEVWEHPLALL